MMLFSFLGYAQEPVKQDSIPKDYIKVEGDSIFRPSIDLDEIYVFNKLNFKSYDEKVRYLILRRKTIKVFPYAKLAAEQLTTLNDSLKKIKKRRKRKRYTKKIQKYIEKEFSAELKKLTRTEGQILIKLVHRQTGITAFALVKELRSGWKAFWYNTTASLFDISLKEEYNPKEEQEDYLIEDILQRAFAANLLKRQKSALDFDYLELSNKWKATSEDKKE
ncbi:DUF4294 domain-containing protein [Spongiivirga citrea]|uniref:DUF4294 domain-containing protein n=1 Tax=Spongiivirga citrea TaxID=1481457 RepID=A0A6M0CKB6_9FLAO|nr:DUF4294 domain-containing protein [Spongiivirga citrea]NER17433.1 DUF4294 domain-containing protein [Spongiivirga citrea]